MSYKTPITRRGYNFGEVASALQKSIRRGLVDDALYWAVELDRSGYGGYVWKRLKIMCSEDVGIAEPMMPANIEALFQNWVEQRKKKDDKHAPERLFLVHAVILLAKAQKSRMVDHALIWHYSDCVEKREIPDIALDKHTQAGRRLQRGWDHFFTEGIHLENHSGIEDPYLEKAKGAMTGGIPVNDEFRTEPMRLFGATEIESLDDETIPVTSETSVW